MRPEKGTYPPYYDHYLPLVKEIEPIEALDRNWEMLRDFITKIPAGKEEFAYAPGKWTVKQVINHVIDTERILAYRALRFARQDPQQPLPFEENKYAVAAELDNRRVKHLLEEFETVRKATRSLFSTFSEETWQRSGKTAAGETTVLAIAYMICGHATHHMNVLKERYLSQ
jgi:uncharacterized damage-inducible protein DinB